MEGALDSFSENKQKAIIRNYIFEIIRPDWKRLLVSSLACVTGTAAAIVSPILFANVMGVVMQPQSCRKQLVRAIGYIGSSYTVEAISTFIYVWQMTIIIENILMRLKREAFASLINKDLAFFDGKPVGEITSLITNDVGVLKSTLRGNLSRDRGLRAALEVIAGVMIILKLSPRLSFVFMVIIPLAATSVAQSGKRLARLEGQELGCVASETSIISEVVRSIRTVRSFGTENDESHRYKGLTGSTAKLSWLTGRNRGRQESISRMAIYLSIMSVFWFGGLEVTKGKLSPSHLFSFIGYCFNLNFGIQGLNFSYTDYLRGSESLKRIFRNTLDINEGKKEANTGVQVIPKTEFKGKVEFRKVSFSYPARPSVKILDSLQISLEAGTVTALVGPSGAGKSTIAALLSRFYTPSKGEILIDGIDIRDLDKKWLTQSIAMVGQSPSLLSGSIAQNIAYGMKSDTPLEDIQHAAKLANADEFIVKFPEGYNTIVGDGGAQLSPGQRQRVAIARALLKGSKILVLDEATSALDAGSEALVQEALNRLMSGRTVLVIAHRLSTVVTADKICVIDGGKVVQCGTHHDLMEEEGMYRTLMKTQVSSYSYLPQ